MGGRGSSKGSGAGNAKGFKTTAAERIFDVENAGQLNALMHTAPKRASHLKIGDVLEMRNAKDRQKNGWNMEGVGKVDLSGAVTITNISSTGKTITITGIVSFRTRQGSVTRKVKKRFNKADTFQISRN